MPVHLADDGEGKAKDSIMTLFLSGSDIKRIGGRKLSLERWALLVLVSVSVLRFYFLPLKQK